MCARSFVSALFGGLSDLSVGQQLPKVEARLQGGGRTLVGLPQKNDDGALAHNEQEGKYLERRLG